MSSKSPSASCAEAEFVQQTALYPEPQYAFRHPLTQEVAYGTQLAAARAATHAAIARGMQETDPELLDERAALIAQHFEQAGDAMQAAQWHARAAGWAGFTDPNAALTHWKRIRELDPDLPPGAEAYPLRIGARTMVLTLGWRLGEDVAEAREVFEEGKALAEGAGDHASLAMLHGALGIIEATCAGNVPEYVRRADEASRVAGPDRRPGPARGGGDRPDVRLLPGGPLRGFARRAGPGAGADRRRSPGRAPG